LSERLQGGGRGARPPNPSCAKLPPTPNSATSPRLASGNRLPSLDMNANRFQHGGRDLGAWLWQLWGESAAGRREAADTIEHQFYMPEHLLCEADDTDAVLEEFGQAVRLTLAQSEFDSVGYVRRLLFMAMALEQKRLEEYREEIKQDDDWHAEQKEGLGDNPTRKEVSRYLRRTLFREMRKLRDGSCDQELNTVVTIYWVMDALSTEFLPAAELLRHMLSETHQQFAASEAIARMGADAIEFYDDLLEGLTVDDSNGYFARPLGQLLRHFPNRIPQVASLLDSEDVVCRRNAAVALGYCGRETVSRYPNLEQRLLVRLKDADPDEMHAIAWGLSEIAVSEEVAEWFLAATRPPNTDFAPTAISCLGRIGLMSERVVPRLIELLDEFEEPDPDYSYHGDHERVVEALRYFADAAKPAISKLLEHVWTAPEQSCNSNGESAAEQPNPDEAVIRFLGDLSAHEALPTLLQIRKSLFEECVKTQTDDDDELCHEENDCCPDYLVTAISELQKLERSD